MGTARVVYRSATSVWQKRWGGDLSDGEEGDGEGRGEVDRICGMKFPQWHSR